MPTTSKITLKGMTANNIDSDQYVDGSIDAVHLSANSVDSDAYVDGSIDTIHIGDDQVTGAKLNPALVSGDIIYADGTDTINRLAKPGTPADEVLTFATSASAPSWAAAGGLTVDIVEATYDLTTAAGTQDITITDFGTIKGCIIHAGVGYDPAWSFAMIDGGGDTNFVADFENVNGDGQWAANNTNFLGIYMAPGVYQYCNGSVITDGIRLTWLKGGSPTGTVSQFCMFFK